MDFLTFIFLAIFGIWLLGIVGRFVLRTWLRNKQRQFEQQFGGGAAGGRSAGSRRRDNRREGDVSVQQTTHVEKKVNKSVGDYVEFEEVEIIEEIREEE